MLPGMKRQARGPTLSSWRAAPPAKRSAVARVTASPAANALTEMQQWLIEAKALPRQPVELRPLQSDVGAVVGCVATQDIALDAVAMEIPQDIAITSVDVEKHPIVGPIAAGRGELTGLTLWLMVERAASASAYAPFLASLPSKSQSPILWDDALRKMELKGSPVLEQAREREAAIRSEWASVSSAIAKTGGAPAGNALNSFTEQAFLEAFSVVLAHTIYLRSAQCFAIIPIACSARRTGNNDGCDIDYDAERESVVVKAKRPYQPGQEVLLNDDRPNGELLLTTGQLQRDNASDCLLYRLALVKADRLYSVKKEVLENAGLQESMVFPLYRDRFPLQMLAFLRFARLQDTAQMAKAAFNRDVIISQENEYEVLQLVMADVRERLSGYIDNQEEDGKMLQGKELSIEQRLATILRLGEKNILLSTTDAIRTRLNPIRGIPTKSGKLVDPNADLLEIFDVIESLPSLPKNAWDSFSRWARGDDDPTFKR